MWDYPRPPALEPSSRRVVVRVGSTVIADSNAAWRVMETSHPPTWYIPRADISERHLRRSAARSSVCEWKGAATYWDVLAEGSVEEGSEGSEGSEVNEVDQINQVSEDAAGDRVLYRAAGWSYQTPTPRFLPITGYLSFMPGQLDCFIDGERVQPQAGGFYGGWITADVVGPFKGEPGSWGW